MSFPLSTALCLTMLTASMATAETVRFGNNQSEWANDGECDDRRFVGKQMATSLDNDDIMRDASDCRAAYKAGKIKLLDPNKALAATDCSKIKFGNNRSKWSNDKECDDYRFDGRGMSSVISRDDIGRDADDCRLLCRSEAIYLRDY